MSVVKNKFAIIGYNCPDEKKFKQIFFPVKVEVCYNESGVITVLRKRDLVSSFLETLFKEIYLTRVCYIKEEKRMIGKGLMPKVIDLIGPDYGWIKFIEEGEIGFRLSDSNKVVQLIVKFEDAYSISDIQAKAFEFIEKRRKSFFEKEGVKF